MLTAESSNQNGETSGCHRCGTKLDSITALCPKCVLAEAFGSIAATDHPALGALAINGRCPTIKSLNEQLDDFEFHELIGRGGSGWTFRATQKSLSRQVAIKLISRNSANYDALERFEREAAILAKLNHPNVVTIHDFGAQEEFLYIVMELVPGTTLRRLMANQKLTLAQVVHICIQVCDALQNAHEKGLIHRDVKPENILVAATDPQIEIRLADFGISRMALDRDSVTGSLTRTGLIIGTPFYMAPEQQLPGRPIDARTDIFSTGVVLYELLTGQLPQGNFPPPSDLSQCGHGIDQVILQALSNEPDKRFETATELKETLIREEALHKDALATRTSSISSTRAEDQATLNLRLLVAALTLAGLIVLPLVFNFGPSISSGGKANKPIAALNPFVVVDDIFESTEIPSGYAELSKQLDSSETAKIRGALSLLGQLPPQPEITSITARVVELTLHEDLSVATDALTALTKLNRPRGIKAIEDAIKGETALKQHAIQLMEQSLEKNGD